MKLLFPPRVPPKYKAGSLRDGGASGPVSCAKEKEAKLVNIPRKRNQSLRCFILKNDPLLFYFTTILESNKEKTHIGESSFSFGFSENKVCL